MAVTASCGRDVCPAASCLAACQVIRICLLDTFCLTAAAPSDSVVDTNHANQTSYSRGSEINVRSSWPTLYPAAPSTPPGLTTCITTLRLSPVLETRGCGGCLTGLCRTFYVSCKWTFIFCNEFIIGFMYGFLYVSYRLDLSPYKFHGLVILFKFQERAAEVHQPTNTLTNNTTFCLETRIRGDLYNPPDLFYCVDI